MTDIMNLWIGPFFWFFVDVFWLALAIMICFFFEGKARFAFLASCLCSFTISTTSLIDTILSNLSLGPLLSYEQPLYSTLFDIGWPFTNLCMSISLAFVILSTKSALTRNKDLEAMLASTLETKPTSPSPSSD